MNYFALTGLINFLTAFFISITLLIKHRRNPAAKIFSVLSIAIAQWSLFYFLFLVSSDERLADLFMRTCMIGVLFIPATFFHFICTLIRKNNANKLILVNYLIGFLFSSFVYTPLYAQKGSSFGNISYWLLPGPLFHIALIHFIFIVVYAHILLVKDIYISEGIRKNQLLYFFVGSVIGFAAGSTNYFYWYRIPIPPVLNICVSFYVAFASYAIMKYRLFDIEIFLKRSVGYLTFILLGCLIGIPLMYVLNQFIQDIFLRSSLAIVFFLIAVPVLLKFKLRSEVSLEQLLFKERFNYRQTLYEISKSISAKVQMKELLAFIVDNFSSKMGIKQILIMLKQHQVFIPIAYFGYNDDEINTLKLTASDPLIQYLSAQKRILIREFLKVEHKTLNQKVIRQMDLLNMEVAIPILSKQELTAICNLGKRGFEYHYTDEDIQAFETFANQLAVALDNARAYKEIEELNATLEQKVKERSDQLIEARKLASIGRLVAGIAHHINNKINPPIQGAAILKKSVRKIKENPAALTAVLPDIEVAVEAVEEELKAVKTIVDDLLISSRQSAGQLQLVPMDLNAAVRSAVRVIRTDCLERVKINEAYAEALPKIKGDMARLDDVFINLMKNALDAIPQKGNIWIKTWEEERQVCVAIRDDGIGIAEENLDKIFDFFFTTKEVGRGTGLGLSVSYATVKDHGGDIQVKSKPGEGTQFIIRLPMV